MEQVVHEPEVEFQPIQCDLCQADDFRVLGYRNRIARLAPKGTYKYRVVRCKRCGLIYVNPQPRLDSFKAVELYDSDYYTTHPMFAINNEVIFARFHRAELEQIEQFAPVGQLLEVGCAHGDFLQEAFLRGWEVTGIDVSEAAISEGRRKFGLPLFRGTLDEVALPDSFFNVVYCNHVLEHTPSPHAVVAAAYTRLKPGGLLVIGVPNEEALSTLIGNLRAKVFREDWTSHLCPPLHLFGFTRDSLCRLLEKVGLSVVKLWTSGAGSSHYPPHRTMRMYLEAEKPTIKRLIMELGTQIGRGELLVAYARK